ncbi:hypothetical protein RQP46_004396 [Phenoliferia psychrophenolica]
MKLFDNLRAWYSPLISPADRAEWAHAGGGIPSAHDVETHQEVIDIFFGAYGHPDALTDRILALGFDVVDFRWVTSCIRKGELVPVEQYCFNYLSGKLTYGLGQDNDDDDSGFSSAGGSEDQPGLFGRSKRARDEKGGQEDEERVTSRRRPSEGEEKDKAATPPPADPAIKVEERSTSPLHFFSPPPATFSDPLSHFFASLRLPDHHPASPPTFSIQDLLAQFPSVLPAFEGLEGQDRSVALRRGLWTVEHGKDGFRAERVRKEERKSEVSA